MYTTYGMSDASHLKKPIKTYELFIAILKQKKNQTPSFRQR